MNSINDDDDYEKKSAAWKEWIDEMGKRYGPEVKTEYERFPGVKEEEESAKKETQSEKD